MNTNNEMNLLSINQLDDIIKLINKTYYLCNGYINMVNRAGGLIISPSLNDKLGTLGTFNGFVVKIYPLNILMNYQDPIKCKASAVYTVLHELSHFDQNINFDMYKLDTKYNYNTEISNDINVLVWMFNHKNFLLDNFPEIDLKLDDEHFWYELIGLESVITNSDSYIYDNITIAGVYHRAFRNLHKLYCDKLEYLEAVSTALIGPEVSSIRNNITLKITDMKYNSFKLKISENHLFYDAGMFNRIMYTYLYQYNMVKFSINERITKDNDMKIHLNIKERKCNPLCPI